MKRKQPFRISIFLLVLFLISLALISCATPTYTVTFVLGEGMENVTAEVNPTSELYTPSHTDENKIFGGWFLDENLTRPYLKTRITGDMTLYARFIERGEYVVTFIYENGTGDTTHVMSGALCEPKEPSKAGYTFVGWENVSTGEMYTFGAAPDTALLYLRAVWQRVSDKVTLTVNYADGVTPPLVESLPYNTTLTPPEAPERAEYSFIGWYLDEAGTRPYDFSAPLTKDLTIYAVWLDDIASVGNKIATEMLLSTVKINVEQMKFGFGGTTGTTSLGSGVIYLSHSGYYYVLTNNHVVAKNPEYSSISYYVIDAYGNKYTATLMAADPAYDLAVLRFAIGEKALRVAGFAEENPDVGDILVSVGNPNGVTNSVTYGKCTRYAAVNIEGGNIAFPVGWHDAPTDHGSSGGAVFDTSMHIAGIGFGGNSYSDGSYSNGVFVPRDKVIEFLSANSLI